LEPRCLARAASRWDTGADLPLSDT
jgi:hypothetical protein